MKKKKNKTNRKVIVGFIGEKGAGKTTAANFLAKHGFYKVSISDKVREFASHLFPEAIERDEEKLINTIRKKGCNVHKYYWLNLILTAIPDSRDLVVFDDLWEEEVNSSVLKVYQVYRKDVSKNKIPNIEILENNDRNSFQEKLREIVVELKSELKKRSK